MVSLHSCYLYGLDNTSLPSVARLHVHWHPYSSASPTFHWMSDPTCFTVALTRKLRVTGQTYRSILSMLYSGYIMMGKVDESYRKFVPYQSWKIYEWPVEFVTPLDVQQQLLLSRHVLLLLQPHQSRLLPRHVHSYAFVLPISGVRQTELFVKSDSSHLPFHGELVLTCTSMYMYTCARISGATPSNSRGRNRAALLRWVSHP